jgi:hypothetical protein
MALDGIQKLRNTTACRGGVVSLVRSPSGGHARGREKEVERRATHQGERGEVTWPVVVCPPPPLGPPFI